MKNRMCFKIISFILVQTFLLINICLAASGQIIIRTESDSTLAPSLTISNIDLELTFEQIKNKVDAELSIDFDQEISVDDDNDIGLKEEPKKGEEKHEMSAFDSSNGSNTAPSGVNPSSTNVLEGNHQDMENILLPPPDDNFVQGALANVDGFYVLNNTESIDEGHDITNGDIMKKFGLTGPDINFLNKILLPIPEKTEFFESIELTQPHPLNKDELSRVAQGPFRVLANTRAQNAVELAASALAIGLPLEIIIGKMISVFSFDSQELNSKSREIVTLLNEIVSIVNSKRDFKLTDVYTLATKLVSDLRQLGIEAVDEGQNRRRKLGVRPHHIPTLREEYIKNPRRMQIYLYEMAPWHEDGHVAPLVALPFQLKWTAFKTKEVALSIFKKLMFGDWPRELQSLGFLTVMDRSQARSAVDAIVISQWLYGYHPLKKEFRNAYWKEALANYYAYLKKLKKENGNDNLAIEMLAIGTHYGIQLNPPDGLHLEANLVNTLNSFFPFLDEGQSKLWTQKVLEMQAEDGVLSQQASQLLEKLKNSKLQSNVSSSTLYSHPAIFATLAAASNTIVGNGTDWMFAMGVAAAIGLTAWAWKNQPFFRSVESRTAQLVNKSIRRKDSSALMRYYQSANVNDRIKIINITAQELSKKSSSFNPELFENIFLNGLNEHSSRITENIQAKISSRLKQRSVGDVNVSEMLTILNETSMETGMYFEHQADFINTGRKFVGIINLLGQKSDLNADSFIGKIEKDRGLDLSIYKMLVGDFAIKTSRLCKTLSVEEAFRTIITDYNDKYSLGLNVEALVSSSSNVFAAQNISDKERRDRLLSNKYFMASFAQAQKNAKLKILFNAIEKYITIRYESQSSSLSKVIVQALEQIFPTNKDFRKSMFPELPILVGRLALEGRLNDQEVFVDQANRIVSLSSVMNAEQMRALHNAIVNILESGYQDPENTKIELVAAEFDKAGLGNTVGALTSGLAAVIMGSSNGNNVTLLDTPLSEIGGMIKAQGLEGQIIQHHLFSKFNGPGQEKVKQIVRNLDNTIINNMALGLFFENINDVVVKELKSLDLRDINEQRAQLILVNTLGKGALLDDLQAVQASEFKNAVENKVDELRYASAVALSNFSQSGAGTGVMIDAVEEYLKQLPDINMDTQVKKNLAKELMDIARNLSSKDKSREILDNYLRNTEPEKTELKTYPVESLPSEEVSEIKIQMSPLLKFGNSGVIEAAI